MSESNSSSTPANYTGYTPGDDFSTQWRNIFSILTGRMTPEGQEQFRLAKDIRNEAADCKRCEDQRDYLLQFSKFIPHISRSSGGIWFRERGEFVSLPIVYLTGPVVKYLSDNIRQLGGDLGSHNIHCRRCTQRKAGGFDPEFGIQICANEMRDQGHLEDTMAHEMVHAYDHLRFKLDWDSDLRHAACTEVFSSFDFQAIMRSNC
jgi:inner membrane protease ATP23